MTESLLAEYFETRERRQQIEREQVKPLKDREDALAADIQAAMRAAEKTSVKRGGFRAFLERVAGRVSWKDAFVKLRRQAEAAGVQIEEPTAEPSERFSVVKE